MNILDDAKKTVTDIDNVLTRVQTDISEHKRHIEAAQGKLAAAQGKITQALAALRRLKDQYPSVIDSVFTGRTLDDVIKDIEIELIAGNYLPASEDVVKVQPKPQRRKIGATKPKVPANPEPEEEEEDFEAAGV